MKVLLTNVRVARQSRSDHLCGVEKDGHEVCGGEEHVRGVGKVLLQKVQQARAVHSGAGDGWR